MSSNETATTTEVVEEVKQELPEGNEVEGKELSPVEKELAELKAQQVRDAELLKKLRRFERENKEAAEKALLDQSKFKELYEAEKSAREALASKVKAKEVDAAIKSELSKFKAKAPDTVLKLIDKSAIEWSDDGLTVDTKSVERALKELKKSDPILFEEEAAPVTPNVKRSGEADVISGFNTEIRAAKTTQEWEAVMKKYGKLQ